MAATHTKRSSRIATGWRIAIVVSATAAVWALMVAVSLGTFGGEVTPLSRIVNALLVCSLAFAVVVTARRLLDRRPWASLGLPGWRDGWRPLLTGVAAFALPAAVGMVVGSLVGAVRITSTWQPPALLLTIAFTALTVLLLEAVPEELIFRGYIYRNLSAVMAPVAAVFVQAALFTLFGVTLWVATEGWSVLAGRAALFFAMGVVLGCLRLVTASVWTPIGFHLAFQTVSQTLFLNDGVVVDDTAAATTWVIVVGFVFAIPLASAWAGRRPNWTAPEPDDAPRSR